MLKRYIVLISVFLLAVIAMSYWPFSGMMPSDYLPVTLEPIGVSVYGDDHGHGNLLAVQPWMSPYSYANERWFTMAMDQYLSQAQRQGLLSSKTIVIFPEYIGTWLVAAGERRQVYTSPDTAGAMKTLIMSHPIRFGKTLIKAGEYAEDSVKYSLFMMKSRQMVEIYDSCFSRLAKTYGVTIVAGSIILPSPTIRDGHLTIGSGRLFNVTPVYGSDGKVACLAEKNHLTAEEQKFAACSSKGGPQVVDTPAGKLGVMICADSWFPKAYHPLNTGGAQFIAVPSFNAPDGVKRPWPGYSGFPNPSDVDPKDLGQISEEEAWVKYALPGRIDASGAQFGLINYFRGRLWDMVSDGYVLVIDHGRITRIKSKHREGMVNVWLP